MEHFKIIHPTKTGGTYVSDTLVAHNIIPPPSDHHDPICRLYPNPIITLRDPSHRFKSMYKYWRFGGQKYSGGKPTGSVDDFIYAITTDRSQLHTSCTWGAHAEPQTHWISPQDFSNTIIVRYTEDMSIQLTKLLEYLKIPVGIISSCRINKSNGSDFNLTNDQQIFVDTFYQKDFELWHKVNNNPDLFRHVI